MIDMVNLQCGSSVGYFVHCEYHNRSGNKTQRN